ncbi:MAG: hypothetical protein QXU82_01425 [Candidatus Aenigmatarchaeota archaeon]
MMEIAEFLLKLMTTVILIFGILGMVMQSISYNGSIVIFDADRMTLNLGQAALSAPCLTETVNGEPRRGVFEVSKLDSAKELCIDLDAVYSVKITGGGRTWSFGGATTKGETRTFPVSLKFSEDRIVAGEMVVRVQAMA